jgi:hypothetical protein
MAANSGLSESCRPFWVPENVVFDRLPAALQAGILQLINPLYQQLVLEATNELARTVGLTLVHLGWLELLGQLELGRAQAVGLGGANPGPVDPKAIAQHLSLVAAKIKTTKLYLQLKRACKQEEDFDAILAQAAQSEDHV